MPELTYEETYEVWKTAFALVRCHEAGDTAGFSALVGGIPEEQRMFLLWTVASVPGMFWRGLAENMEHRGIGELASFDQVLGDMLSDHLS